MIEYWKIIFFLNFFVNISIDFTNFYVNNICPIKKNIQRISTKETESNHIRAIKTRPKPSNHLHFPKLLLKDLFKRQLIWKLRICYFWRRLFTRNQIRLLAIYKNYRPFIGTLLFGKLCGSTKWMTNQNENTYQSQRHRIQVKGQSLKQIYFRFCSFRYAVYFYIMCASINTYILHQNSFAHLSCFI